MFQCGDNEALVGYVYGECEADERRVIDAHLVVCAKCAKEVEALGATRQQLTAWTPPDARLDFQIVSARAPEPKPPARVLRPAVWLARPLPVWAQMAAAVIIFGVGLSLGVLRGGIAPDGSPVATGPAATTAAAETRVAPAPAPSERQRVEGAAEPRVASVSDLAALEQRLRAEMVQLRAAEPARAAAPTRVATSSVSEADIMARVRALIDESEQRQQRELALRTTQLARDFESQRRLDLQNVRSIVGQVEGTTGAEIARQQQTLQYLMRVSQQR
jgi:anti-sigma factor RsiW